ncbi:MAG TPA: ATP-binding protein [Chloroflexota bacterium]|jgi:signal transduction histidine kinase
MIVATLLAQPGRVLRLMPKRLLGSRSPAREEPHFVRVERAIVQVRWLAIVIVALAAPFAGLTPEALLGTYGVVLAGTVYTLTLQFAIIEYRPGLLAGGYLTSLAEAILVSLIALATGGAASTMFLAYFLIVVAAALRYGFRSSLVAAGLSMGSYSVVAMLEPGATALGLSELLLRFGFLVMTGMEAGFLAQEAHQSRVALAMELEHTRELHRESTALAQDNARLYTELHERLQELERTHDQLIQSAKLAAIGELAANVAHEINNPLTAVLTNAELLADDYGAENTHTPELQTIREEALRARGIVRSLLDFARQTPPKLELTEPEAIVQAVIPLVHKRAAVANVEIRHSSAAGPLPILVDVNQMKQVFINLLTNAIDAMPNGGIVSVTERRQDDRVEIVVSDTGMGIRPEHRDRIFEPFFTTKPGVSGTGLGLSVSYGIVERHRGTITVDSTIGVGTTFTVGLPFAKAPGAASSSRQGPRSRQSTRGS